MLSEANASAVLRVEIAREKTVKKRRINWTGRGSHPRSGDVATFQGTEEIIIGAHQRSGKLREFAVASGQGPRNRGKFVHRKGMAAGPPGKGIVWMVDDGSVESVARWVWGDCIGRATHAVVQGREGKSPARRMETETSEAAPLLRRRQGIFEGVGGGCDDGGCKFSRHGDY